MYHIVDYIIAYCHVIYIYLIYKCSNMIKKIKLTTIDLKLTWVYFHPTKKKLTWLYMSNIINQDRTINQ